MKKKRLQALLHVIQTRDVGTQEELLSILKGRGFDVNVATISRDLRELGIVKAPAKSSDGKSSFKYVLPPTATSAASALDRLVNEYVESMTAAENFIVIKTRPRCAILISSEIDKAGWEEMMGTIAGDDTIVGICHSKTACAKALKRLRAMARS